MQDLWPLRLPPKAVLFDCDGVIVDSEGPVFEMLVTELGLHGLHMDSEGLHRMFLGGTLYTLADRARALGADLPGDWAPRFYQRIFDRLADGTPLIPGILDLLDRLDAAAIPYGIGSNGPARKMEITLGQHAGLTERFRGHIYSAHDIGASKPDPALYLHLAAALGVAPQDAVVIEDSATGARAAFAAQIPCFGYAAETDGASLSAVGARPFHAMKDLPALLDL